jgi:hypothetical protein
MTIEEAIRALAGNNDEIYSVVGKVTAVDKSKLTCTVEPIDGGAEIYGVRFAATLSDTNTFAPIPKQGSDVVVTFLNKNAAFVSLFGEVDKYIIKNGNESLKDILNQLCIDIQALTVSTALGPSSVPINAAAFSAIQNRLSLILEE